MSCISLWTNEVKIPINGGLYQEKKKKKEM